MAITFPIKLELLIVMVKDNLKGLYGWSDIKKILPRKQTTSSFLQERIPRYPKNEKQVNIERDIPVRSSNWLIVSIMPL